MDLKEHRVEAEWQYRLWKKSAREQGIVGELSSHLGSVRELRCLYVTGQDGELGCHLSQQGGKWQHVVLHDYSQAYLSHHTTDKVLRIDGAKLPFESATFDMVVVDRACEFVEDDFALIAECHRVLQADGQLVINASRTSSYSPLHLVRVLVGWSKWAKRYRRGYSEAELFNILKDGFDVANVKKYSRFFVEVVDLLIRAMARRIAPAPGVADSSQRFERIERLYERMGPVVYLAKGLDVLLFLSQGHCMVVHARPRPWRPRFTPKLNDGRSIAEATLSSKIGTAAPF